ncbi:substrate-binding periplasmic protein [Undibacterium sp.]|uniref:substrate-binding periplasmic protein n=1 Tax=Undibacterium sp. TaxID=1914977 RepID=UPI003751D3FC
MFASFFHSRFSQRSTSQLIRRSLILITIFFTSSFSPSHASDKPILRAVSTDEAFPYSFRKNQEMDGMVFEVAKTLADRIGYQLKVEVLPWTRALLTARDQPSTLIFSVVKTPSREPHYYWIGPVATSEVWLFKLASRSDITVQNVEDLKKYIVGDIASDATLPLFEKLGIKVDTAPSKKSNCLKLKMGRVDLIPFDPDGIEDFLSACDIPASNIEKTIYFPRDTALYMAIGKKTPPELIKQLNAGFAQMVSDKTLSKIVAKWKSKVTKQSPVIR